MPGKIRNSARVLMLSVAVVLTGCASLGSQLPMATADESAQELAFGVRTLGADGQFELLPSDEVARRLEARLGERPLRILALSAGGATGAFGAGALAGSTSAGQRPEFSVVTGVSAGALLAPLAFLGPAWDAELTAIYTTGVSDGLLQPRLLGAVFGSSVYSGAPLRRLIERYADDDMMAAVALQAARGRLLLVATTDFATGEPVIWDLGSIALYGGPNAKRLFRSVLLASASVPGVFPPVVVRFRSDGRMRTETHVDGGVTLPFFVAPAPKDLSASTGGGPPAIVRIIIDGPLRDVPRPTHANTYSIFRRSVSAGLTRMMRTALESTVAAAREHGISLEYSAVPASYPLRGAFDFDPAVQRSLFEYAANCAETGRLWIGAQSVEAASDAAQSAASATPTCPADDSFIGRLAALAD
jgi:predicted acylesterase/phospholipase RssA